MNMPMRLLYLLPYTASYLCDYIWLSATTIQYGR